MKRDRTLRRIELKERKPHQRARTVKPDVLAALETTEGIATHLKLALETGDLSLFLAFLRDCVDAVGVSEVAKESGITKMSIYRSVSVCATGELKLSTLYAILRALKVKLNSVVPVGGKQ